MDMDARSERVDTSTPAPGLALAHHLAEDRYRVVPCGMKGYFGSYRVLAGNGTRTLFKGTEDQCEKVATELRSAFLDGAFIATKE